MTKLNLEMSLPSSHAYLHKENRLLENIDGFDANEELNSGFRIWSIRKKDIV